MININIEQRHNYKHIRMIIAIISFCLFFSVVGCRQNNFNPRVYFAEAVSTKGALVKLSNKNIVQIAGIYIPLGGINYDSELLERIDKILSGKKVKINVILTAKKDYPRYPLVAVYVNGNINIAEQLLKEGMAFFDYGYYPNYKKYRKLQQKAQNEKRGIWGRKDFPQVLFTSNELSMDIHLLGCPIFNKERKLKVIEYYFIPQQIHYYKFYAFNCPYCRKDESHKKDFIDYYYVWNKEKYLPQ